MLGHQKFQQTSKFKMFLNGFGMTEVSTWQDTHLYFIAVTERRALGELQTFEHNTDRRPVSRSIAYCEHNFPVQLLNVGPDKLIIKVILVAR